MQEVMQMGDRVILHSDINCCYASIEHLHHPELAGKPLAVGGDPEARHGIVLTADYIAKKYGDVYKRQGKPLIGKPGSNIATW